mmetsp:Transcript_19336/g.56187  ORF Transcript_19336/g.56187 Transcript_19336/m.56187 type:complete len:357 (+) Transcript_19336:989-2059(+)
MADEARLGGPVVVFLLRRLDELHRILRLPNALLGQAVDDRAALRLPGPRAVRLAPAGRVRLVIAERGREQGPVVLQDAALREGDAGDAQGLPIGLGSAAGPANAEEDDGVALPLEVGHEVAPAAVEHQQVLAQVDAQPILLAQRAEGRPRPVVLGPVLEHAAGEVPEGRDHRRPVVVAVPVQPGRVVFVHINGGEHELPAELLGQVVLQPSAHEPRHRRVMPGGGIDTDRAIVARDQPEGIAVDPRPTFGHHVLPRGVLLEAPEAQHVEKVRIRHRSPAVGLAQDQPGHGIGLDAAGVQFDAVAAHAVRCEVAPVDAQPVGNGEGPAPTDPLPMHRRQDLVGPRPCVVPSRLAGVD